MTCNVFSGTALIGALTVRVTRTGSKPSIAGPLPLHGPLLPNVISDDTTPGKPTVNAGLLMVTSNCDVPWIGVTMNGTYVVGPPNAAGLVTAATDGVTTQPGGMLSGWPCQLTKLMNALALGTGGVPTAPVVPSGAVIEGTEFTVAVKSIVLGEAIAS